MQVATSTLAQKVRGTLTAWRELGLHPMFKYVCDETNSVMSLNLQSSNLSGTLPEDLGTLIHLQWLNFRNNPQLVGPLPINLQVLGCLAGADFRKTGMRCSGAGALEYQKAEVAKCPALRKFSPRLLSTSPHFENLTGPPPPSTIDSLCPFPFFLQFAQEGQDAVVWDDPVEEPHRCKSRIRCRTVTQALPTALSCLPVRAFSMTQRVSLGLEIPRGPVQGQQYVEALLNFTSSAPFFYEAAGEPGGLGKGGIKLDPHYYNYEGCECIDADMKPVYMPAPQPSVPPSFVGMNLPGIFTWLVPTLSSNGGAEYPRLLRCVKKNDDTLAFQIAISVAGLLSAAVWLLLTVFIIAHRNEIAFGIVKIQRRYMKRRSMPGFSTYRKLNRFLKSLFEPEDRGVATAAASEAQLPAAALPVVVVSCALICPPDLREAPEWDVAVAAFTRVCRRSMEKCCGAEHLDEGQSASVFTGIFHEPGDAVQFALLTQFKLLRYPWPRKAARAPHTCQFARCPDMGYQYEGRRLVYCGPACSMGITIGKVTGVARGLKRRKSSYLYGEYREETFGPIARAELLAGSCPDGRVLLQSDVYAYVSGGLADVSKRVESSLHSGFRKRSQRFCRKAVQAVSSVWSYRGKRSKRPAERSAVVGDLGGAEPHEPRPSESPAVSVNAPAKQAGDPMWCYPVVLAIGRYRLHAEGVGRSLKSRPVMVQPSTTSITYPTPSPSLTYYPTDLSTAQTHVAVVDKAGGGSCCVEIDLFELVPRCLLERVIQRAEQQLTGEQLTPGFLDAPGARESLQNDLTPPPPPKGSWTLQSSMATPPLPDITVAFVAGEKLGDLSIVDESLYDAVLTCYNCCVQLAVSATGGYVCQELGGIFMLAFASPAAALEFALLLQYVLMEAAWDESLLQLKSAGTVTEGSQLLFRGVRARCGIFKGIPSCVVPHRTTGRADVFGTIVNRASRFQSAAYGGQILMSDEVHRDAQDAWKAGASGGGDRSAAVRVVARDIGRFRFKGVETSYRIIELTPAALQARQSHIPSRPPAGKSRMLRSGKGRIGESRVHLPDARALVARHQVGMEPFDRPHSLQLNPRKSIFMQ